MVTMPKDWLLRSRLNPRQLALLVNLDEKRSILHAAAAAHLTQPAASKLLTSLEAALGVELFARHARGVEPTVYGEIIVRHARGALAELRQAHEELAAARSGLIGEVAIGTVVTSATKLVPTAVAALKRDYPGIRVSIEVDFSETLLAKMREHKFDIVIARLHNAAGMGEFEFQELEESPHGIAVRVDHPLLHKRALTLLDLVPQTWILPPPGNVLRDSVTELFLRKRVPLPQSVVETAAMPIIVNLLGRSEMVAPLALELIEPFREAGVLGVLPLAFDVRLGAAGILTRRDQRHSPAAQVALNALRHAAQKTGATAVPRRAARTAPRKLRAAPSRPR
jgi:DNA-binding transcriptional LysR family regulator